MAFSPRLSNLEVVQVVFKWFNAVGKGVQTFNLTDVENYFTSSATMISNDSMKCQGINGHYKHFVEISKKLKAWEVSPFLFTVSENDKLVARYFLNFTTSDGKVGKTEIMACWTISANKIQNTTEVMYFHSGEIALENHK